MQQVNLAREDVKEDTVDGLKSQLETLMNSLAVLSAEKSRMEASFQSEKKQIRGEREEVCNIVRICDMFYQVENRKVTCFMLQYERVVKNLKDKLKRIQGHAVSEVEHLKYKLIMERHEREKEQTEHSTLTKYVSNQTSLIFSSLFK